MPVRAEPNPPSTAATDPPNRRHGVPSRKTVSVVVACVAVLLVVGATVLALHWPFTRAALMRSLEQDSQGQVKIGSFQETYFPHPGAVANDVTFERDASSPRLTIRRLTIVGSYFGLLHRYIPRVIAEGAVLSVPPGEMKELFASHSGQQPTDTSVGEIVADGAQVVVATEDNNPPLAFDFHELKLHGVSKDSAVHFVALLQTPEPTGDLQLQGTIGPFRRDQAGITPLSGTYSYKNAKLEEFIGIGGVLSSEGKFNGQLQAINVDGATDTPDFQLDVGVHPVDLKNKFHALVNGTNGDLQLDPVESSWGKTTVITRGTIEGPRGAKKLKTITLDMTCQSGRVQDLLRLFVHDDQPPMSGAIAFQAHVMLPPQPDHFLNEVRLQGKFSIKGARYTTPGTQQQIDILSADARGQADKIEDDQDKQRKTGNDAGLNRDLQPVISNFTGNVVLRNAIADFQQLTFEVPGATALMHGTYDLRSRQINMQGTAHLQSQLSGATTGMKSFLLKVIGPFRPHQNGEKGSTVEVRVTGTYGRPSFAVQPMKGGQ